MERIAPAIGRQGVPAPGAAALRQVRASALLVDAAGCSPALLRLAAAVQQAGGGACIVVGTGADARRAADAGLRVVAACAPPAGSLLLGAGAMKRAFAPALGRSSAVTAWGPRAAAVARLLGLQAHPEPDALPPALAALPREALRDQWGVDPGLPVIVAVASPAASGDARAALDIIGRAAIIGGPCALVVHPGAGRIARTQRWAQVSDAGWHLVLDERVDEPELLATAADAAIAIEVAGTGDAVRSERPAGAVGTRHASPMARWSDWSAQLARGMSRAPATAHRIAALLAARAGLPVAVAMQGPAAPRLGAACPECIFDARRPNVGAQIVHRLLRDSAFRARVCAAQRAVAEAVPVLAPGTPAALDAPAMVAPL